MEDNFELTPQKSVTANSYLAGVLKNSMLPGTLLKLAKNSGKSLTELTKLLNSNGIEITVNQLQKSLDANLLVIGNLTGKNFNLEKAREDTAKAIKILAEEFFHDSYEKHATIFQQKLFTALSNNLEEEIERTRRRRPGHSEYQKNKLPEEYIEALKNNSPLADTLTLLTRKDYIGMPFSKIRKTLASEPHNITLTDNVFDYKMVPQNHLYYIDSGHRLDKGLNRADSKKLIHAMAEILIHESYGAEREAIQKAFIASYEKILEDYLAKPPEVQKNQYSKKFTSGKKGGGILGDDGGGFSAGPGYRGY